MNETRWRLLMQLQQQQSRQAENVTLFLKDGLVAIAGAVPTPEGGYHRDLGGGLSGFLADVKILRQQHDRLAEQLKVR